MAAVDTPTAMITATTTATVITIVTETGVGTGTRIAARHAIITTVTTIVTMTAMTGTAQRAGVTARRPDGVIAMYRPAKPRSRDATVTTTETMATTAAITVANSQTGNSFGAEQAVRQPRVYRVV